MLSPADIENAKEEARLIIESIDDHAEGGGSEINWRRDRDALLDRLNDRKPTNMFQAPIPGIG